MKYITAVIRPHKLDEVREALLEVGIQGLSATEIRGFGRQKGHKELYRGAEYKVEFVPKVKIEMAMKPELVERSIEVIQKCAKTGAVGDGKIFVWDLEQVVRVRTGERDTSAL